MARARLSMVRAKSAPDEFGGADQEDLEQEVVDEVVDAATIARTAAELRAELSVLDDLVEQSRKAVRRAPTHVGRPVGRAAGERTPCISGCRHILQLSEGMSYLPQPGSNPGATPGDRASAGRDDVKVTPTSHSRRRCCADLPVSGGAGRARQPLCLTGRVSWHDY